MHLTVASRLVGRHKATEAASPNGRRNHGWQLHRRRTDCNSLSTFVASVSSLSTASEIKIFPDPSGPACYACEARAGGASKWNGAGGQSIKLENASRNQSKTAASLRTARPTRPIDTKL